MESWIWALAVGRWGLKRGEVLQRGRERSAGSGLDLKGPTAYAEALLVLALIVTVHECGHFLAARLQNIHVSQFAIGFGPSIFKYKVPQDVATVPVLLRTWLEPSSRLQKFMQCVAASLFASALVGGRRRFRG